MFVYNDFTLRFGGELLLGMFFILSDFRRIPVSNQSVNSIKLQSNYIEVARHYGYSPVNFLHLFRTPFPKNTSEGLLLVVEVIMAFSSLLLLKHLFLTTKFIYK